LVKLLLAKGSDVYARNNHDTVLHRAVSSGNEEVIRLILDKIKEKETQLMYQHINAPDTEGDTPLMWAAEKGGVNVAQILLEYGADINARDEESLTALHFAVKGGCSNFVQLLLNNRVDSNIKDKKGKSPLDLALAHETNNEAFKTIVDLLVESKSIHLQK
jgi:ankyrin repeat protein